MTCSPARRWSVLATLAACVRTEAPIPAEATFTYPLVDLTGFVDPFLGTAGAGNVIPGAVVPHGAVRASPDTLGERGGIDAYDWDHTAMEGFTHTHLQGPGGSFNGYSQVLLLPQTGPLVADRDLRAVPFDHAGESARPGYYGVGLANGVSVELTATGLAAVHRYTFPAGEARLIVDLGHSLGTSKGGALHIDGSTLSGWGDYEVHPYTAAFVQDGTTGRTVVYAAIEVSLPPQEAGTLVGQQPVPSPGSTEASGAWTAGWVGWTFDAPTTVEVRVGLSWLDEEQARVNREAQVGGHTFEEVAEAADAAWNQALNRVVIEAEPDLQGQLYTALYHSLLNPSDHTEVGNRYVIRTSGQPVVRSDEPWRYYTDDWCLWDTYRTTHPLGALVEPELRDDIISSMLRPHEEGGWLDKCSWTAGGYSRVMIGNHEIPVFADAVVKGLDGFDTELAWEAVEKVSMEEWEGTIWGICGYVNLGTIPEYLSLGFVPTECDPTQAASMTLETAYDDATASWLARALGKDDRADMYASRAGNWRNQFDPAVGFMRGRHADGTWREPFDPMQTGGFSDFVESDAWTFSFFVPHDVPGLASLYGGEAGLVDKLDGFYASGKWDVSNEPGFHIPWLYTLVGRPDRTAEVLRDTLVTSFSSGPGGLPGNDDSGATSAWLVFAMLGLYPVAPGDPTYTISAPKVRSATIRLHPAHYDGGTFTVSVEGDPVTMPYVAGVQVDGQSWEGVTISHARIAAGGDMVVTLSATPTAWGRR